MANHWNSDQVNKISLADDLKISPLRNDGETYGTPTWIWNVSLNNELYVRAYHGQKSSWYQSAIKNKTGRIHAAGMLEEVRFESVNGNVNDLIDRAYQEKYKGSPYLNAMTSERAKSATVKIIPN